MKLLRGNKSGYFKCKCCRPSKECPNWENIKTNAKRFYFNKIMIFYMEKAIN